MALCIRNRLAEELARDRPTRSWVTIGKKCLAPLWQGPTRRRIGNIGDCCAYALAQARGERLLFKGTDFPQTDVAAVPY